MSRRKLFVIILAIIAIALIVSLVVVPGLADTLRDGIVEYGGPIGTWVVDTYNGFAMSSFAQTYLVPPWNAFGFGCLFLGIIALLIFWKKDAIHLPRKTTTSLATASATHAGSTPMGATTRPATTAEKVASVTEEEESTKT